MPEKLLIPIAFLSWFVIPVQSQKIFRIKYGSLADLKVYVVTYESQADLKIFRVGYKSRAGWRNLEKSHLLMLPG